MIPSIAPLGVAGAPHRAGTALVSATLALGLPDGYPFSGSPEVTIEKCLGEVTVHAIGWMMFEVGSYMFRHVPTI